MVAFLNPRSIGRAVRLGRRWAEVGYDEPLYYCFVQVGQPSVTIYAFQARVDAVVHTASGDKGVSCSTRYLCGKQMSGRHATSSP